MGLRHNRYTSALTAFLVLGALGVTLGACAKGERLKELEMFYLIQKDPAYVEVNFCTQKADVIQTRTKYIFVLDKSGSNTQNYVLNPDGSIAQPFQILNSLATDPTGDRRYQQLIQFLQNSPQDPLKYYSLINFSNSASRVRNFTTDVASFQTTVQNEYANLNDQGATNYEAALDLVYNLINTDITAATTAPQAVASTYIIIWVSDGFPILSINTSTNPITVNAQQPANIFQKVRNIVSLQSNAMYVDSINLFTGYYFVTGNEDPAARQLLKDMAETYGNGVAYEFGTGKSVDFSMFTVPQKVIKYNLSDIFVSNASATWWDDATFSLDSDLDGLPDKVESQLGSDSLNRDSDRNGVSDFVEYRVSGNTRPCTSIVSGRCSASGATSYRTINPNLGGCSSVVPISTSGGVVVFPDNDRDGLNDCEEMILGNPGGVNNYDSNGDMVPDGLEYKNGVEFKVGTSPAGGDLDLDGMTNFNEIKFFMPPGIPNRQLLNAQPYRYDLTMVSASGLQDCYSLKVYDVQTIGSDNMIRVHLIENTAVVANKTIFRVAEKRFPGNSKVLVINDIGQEAAGVWK